jgi:hypothetical protein
MKTGAWVILPAPFSISTDQSPTLYPTRRSQTQDILPARWLKLKDAANYSREIFDIRE